MTNDNLPKSFNYTCKGNQNRIDRADFEKMEKFLNCPSTKKGILACKEKLKSSKASVVDMIKNEVLKIRLDNKIFLESLQLLFNKIFNDGKYPASWKTELIRPIHKKRGDLLGEKLQGY